MSDNINLEENRLGSELLFLYSYFKKCPILVKKKEELNENKKRL